MAKINRKAVDVILTKEEIASMRACADTLENILHTLHAEKLEAEDKNIIWLSENEKRETYIMDHPEIGSFINNAFFYLTEIVGYCC